MKTIYFTYGPIIRVLKLEEENPSKSLMIDVNTDDNTILSIFDASTHPNDYIFIRSFLNILSESTVGFQQTVDQNVINTALNIISVNLPTFQL